jgi:hypothetical protein
VDGASAESTTPLAAEQIGKIEVPCCDSPTPLDGISWHGDRDWRYERAELAKAERRLGLPSLGDQCRPGSADAYAFVHAQGFSWSSYEEAIAVRQGSDALPAELIRVIRRPDEPDSSWSTRRARLSSAEWSLLASRLDELQARRFPASIEGGCTDAPVWYFASCLAGEFRMTYLECPRSRPDANKMRGKSAFFSAAATLIESADAHGLHASHEPE